MRTTVNISGHLLARAKARAAEDGGRLGDVIDRSLQEYLAAHPGAPRGPGLDLPVFRAAWVAPVDMSSNREVFDYLDHIDATDARPPGGPASDTP
ncbi:MAG: hypothetical protein LBT54_04330 [Bifidobacteriaceae bacterium]|jgi:hypothetical protein|nr:hypothetical protein [Bifidobacteriaceae bacterium]